MTIAVAAAVAQDQTGHGDSANSPTGTASDYRLPAHVASSLPPTQPIAFSHARHAGTLALKCVRCHVGANPDTDGHRPEKHGAAMTLPDTSICMGCHVGVATERPDIQVLTDFHTSRTPVPWQRVYRVLHGVNWTHEPHLQADIACQTCHGDVASMEIMAVATPVTAMASCLGCHRATTASATCETCHSWPGAGDMEAWSDVPRDLPTTTNTLGSHQTGQDQ